MMSQNDVEVAGRPYLALDVHQELGLPLLAKGMHELPDLALVGLGLSFCDRLGPPDRRDLAEAVPATQRAREQERERERESK